MHARDDENTQLFDDMLDGLLSDDDSPRQDEEVSPSIQQLIETEMKKQDSLTFVTPPSRIGLFRVPALLEVENGSQRFSFSKNHNKYPLTDEQIHHILFKMPNPCLPTSDEDTIVLGKPPSFKSSVT